MYSQITDLSSIVTLTLPTGRVNGAKIQAEAANVRYRDDGGTPTGTVGFVLYAGAAPTTFTIAQLGLLQFIEAAEGAILNVEYF